MSLQDGIEAARLVLPRCWFDESGTYEGLEHLRAYMREWDERTQTYRNKSKHDQHSHASDSFRYLALAARPVMGKSQPEAKSKPLQGRGAHYSFSLEQIWDTGPQQAQRIG